MTDTIDTEGEVTSDEVTAEDIAADDLPAYTLAGTVEWLRRPENAERIERFGKALDEVPKKFMHKLDAEVSKVGRLAIDIAMRPDVARDFGDSLLRSLTGIED